VQGHQELVLSSVDSANACLTPLSGTTKGIAMVVIALSAICAKPGRGGGRPRSRKLETALFMLVLQVFSRWFVLESTVLSLKEHVEHQTYCPKLGMRNACADAS